MTGSELKRQPSVPQPRISGNCWVSRNRLLPMPLTGKQSASRITKRSRRGRLWLAPFLFGLHNVGFVRTKILDLVTALPAELQAGVIAAIAILAIGGMGVGLIEFAYRKDLISHATARRLSLVVVTTVELCSLILAISVVVLLLWSTFGKILLPAE